MREKIKKILPNSLLTILKKVRYIGITLLFFLFHKLPIDKNKIVVCNVWGFGDNAKYVAKELVERKKNELKEYKVYFITNRPNAYTGLDNLFMLKTNSISAIYALATAKVWVDNNRKESYIKKRKGQYYIQTWHGGIALKKIEKDYEECLGDKYVKNAKRDSAMADLYISNSDFCTNMYLNSFWYKGEILECGSPRSDILLHVDEKRNEAIRKRLHINSQTKLAIYAPTYRESSDTSVYELDYYKLLLSLEKRFGEPFILAIRLHPLVSQLSDNFTYDSKIINVSNYPDLYELMAIGDVLITDFSNIMFEFSYMKKPVFLYAKDRRQYEKQRGFYFEYSSLPYHIGENEEELFQHINHFDQELYESRIHGFFEHIKLYETGHASNAVVNRILSIIE